MRQDLPTLIRVLLVGALLPTSGVFAQDFSLSSQLDQSSANFKTAPASLLNENNSVLNIQRNVEAKDFQGALVNDALNYNIGLQLTPLKGLNVRADAWRFKVNEAPVNSLVGNQSGWTSGSPKLYIEDSVVNEFNIDDPLLGSNRESNGFDLGVSYVWDSNRFGQFTLSTKSTYVQNFESNGSLLDLVSPDINIGIDRIVSSKLQNSLMLNWQVGNHSASAITNYFDSFKDLSEIDIAEINDLVDNITTVDLQYGYSVETGSNDRAIISFGIKNIFDEKTNQLINTNTQILDQNGRVAYGSIKYQF
jgi:hypothetical protein